MHVVNDCVGDPLVWKVCLAVRKHEIGQEKKNGGRKKEKKEKKKAVSKKEEREKKVIQNEIKLRVAQRVIHPYFQANHGYQTAGTNLRVSKLRATTCGYQLAATTHDSGKAQG